MILPYLFLEIATAASGLAMTLFFMISFGI